MSRHTHISQFYQIIDIQQYQIANPEKEEWTEDYQVEAGLGPRILRSDEQYNQPDPNRDPENQTQKEPHFSANRRKSTRETMVSKRQTRNALLQQ